MAYVLQFNYPSGCELIVTPGINQSNNKKGGRKGRKSNDVGESDRSRVYRRIKKEVRRFSLANGLVRHFMLSFRDNVLDPEVSDNEFKKFMDRLRKYKYKSKGRVVYPYKHFKYIAVRERQKRRGLANQDLGTVHYHMLGSSYIPWRLLRKIWKNGHVSCVYHNKGIKAINYVCKYLEKDMQENNWQTESGFSKKGYLCSQGLGFALEKCKIATVCGSCVADEIIRDVALSGDIVYKHEFKIECIVDGGRSIKELDCLCMLVDWGVEIAKEHAVNYFSGSVKLGRTTSKKW